MLIASMGFWIGDDRRALSARGLKLWPRMASFLFSVCWWRDLHVRALGPGGFGYAGLGEITSSTIYTYGVLPGPRRLLLRGRRVVDANASAGLIMALSRPNILRYLGCLMGWRPPGWTISDG
jgi:hypothetical protein